MEFVVKRFPLNTFFDAWLRRPCRISSRSSKRKWPSPRSRLRRQLSLCSVRRRMKNELNFSEWGSYSERRADHKLEESSELVLEEEMPLPSYLKAHSEARLTSDQRKQLASWFDQVRETMKADTSSSSHTSTGISTASRLRLPYARSVRPDRIRSEDSQSSILAVHLPLLLV